MELDSIPESEISTIDSDDRLVISNELEVHPYWHLTVSASKPMLKARPGQFFHLLCPVGLKGNPYLRRPMSVHSIDSDSGQISFLYKVGGVGTSTLATLRSGDSLGILGPLGVGFTIPNGTKNAIIVARGVGLATMAPLAQALNESGIELTTICSYRDRLATIGDGIFSRFGSVTLVYDTDGTSHPNSIRSLVWQRHQEKPIDVAYTCGSRRITTLMQELSAELGVYSEVAVEQRMACGLGMCHACVVPVSDGAGGERQVRVCTDGPVFPIGAIR